MPPARIERRPIGVVGVIGAWNYPILLNAPVIAHAIAAGNAVVWKPSELSSRCGALLQETIDAAGLPEGLVSIVQGGPEVGSALVHANVAKLIFTGGLHNGRRVLETLGARGIPAVVELSGFDAAVVLPDAPDDRTMAALRWSAFLGAGQACMSVKRVFLVDRPAEAWAQAFARQADALRIGDPKRPDVDLGPLISDRARDAVHEQVQAALSAGARLLAGGEPVDGPGSFYRPTVLLADRGREAPERALEGIFGPVVIVREVADDRSAVEAVNASRFGLSASVWGRDRRRAKALADRLDVGVVGVNEATTFFAHASAPAGGVKGSGFGRVHGAEGLVEMTAPRTVVSRSINAPRPQVFPYSNRLGRVLRVYRRLVHR
jgi:acyl-CoA reductase-like NAD-dependent aldehyde dehydrogenase